MLLLIDGMGTVPPLEIRIGDEETSTLWFNAALSSIPHFAGDTRIERSLLLTRRVKKNSRITQTMKLIYHSRSTQ
jgi:hypothetical protein